MDRVTTRTDPLTRAESYTYDANGNLTSVTDRKSQTTSLTYDALDRPTQRTFQEGATIAYTWDVGNRLTQLVDSVSGTITRTYDGLDRVLTEATPHGTVTYTYDAAGRRATMAVPGQSTISYGYDNPLTSITQGSAVASFEYDDANRRTRLTLPNGVKTEYAYDASSRLTGLTYKLGGATLGNLTYTYNGASQRTKVGGTWARTLLPGAVGSATYDAANQQTAFNGQSQTFDLNGNLTGDGTNTYTWDARNHLASISGPVPASFVYDPVGRRQRKTINGTVSDFVYDGLNPVKEAVGSTTVNLLTGLGIDEYLARTSGGTTEYFLSEALGTTVALADGAGAVATEYSYAPFGTAATSGTSSSNELGYTGREDDGTGVYYYRARYYHPGLQRFLSEDPIEFDGGDVNLYAYVANRPTDSTDPLGLFGIEDLPTIPAPVVNGVAGFGDAFLIPILVRWALDIDDVVDRCSAEYRGGMVGGIVVGSVPFVLRGVAALGASGTRIGHLINHNRLLRFGPGRMPAAGCGLPAGPRCSEVISGPPRTSP